MDRVLRFSSPTDRAAIEAVARDYLGDTGRARAWIRAQLDVKTPPFASQGHDVGPADTSRSVNERRVS